MDEIYEIAYGTENVELEARIKGQILTAVNVRRLLSTYQDWTVIDYTEKRSKVIGLHGSIYRSINDTNIVLKTKVHTLKCRDDWYSLVLSTEEKVKEMTLVSRFFSPSTKRRWSRSLGKYLRLDVTYFNEDGIYQVEIEVTKLREKSKGKLLEYIKKVVDILQDSPMYVSRKRFELVRELTNNLKYQKPVTLPRNKVRTVLSGEGVYMTAKKDGVRRFLVIFNGMTYSVDTKNHVRLLRTDGMYTSSVPRIIDTEYVNGKYFVFDLVDKTLSLHPRLKLVSRLCEDMDVVLKEYYPVNSITDVSNFWKEISGTDDGIIFTTEKALYHDTVWKWKEHVTIDSYIGKEVYELELLDPDTTKVVRLREDKEFPNSKKVVENNISEGLPLRWVWDGKSCFLMRRYHNSVKKLLLGDVKGKVILDIGTGHGADIRKWTGARRVYCIEPVPNEEFQRRLETSDVKVRMVSGTKFSKKVDIMSVFFCLNQFSPEDLHELEHTVSRTTPDKIVGIFMDGDLVPNRQETFCYSVRNLDKERYRLTLFETRVVDQVERRVYLPQLKFTGYKLVDDGVLSGGIMSPCEMELSRMFRYFVFTR
jgi:hypothetical protein